MSNCIVKYNIKKENIFTKIFLTILKIFYYNSYFFLENIEVIFQILFYIIRNKKNFNLYFNPNKISYIKH